MKICFISSVTSIHSYRWIKYFVEKGENVYWISLSANLNFEFSEILKFSNLKIFFTKNYSNKILKFLKNILFVKKIIKEIKPDILHAHTAGINGFAGALTGFHPFILSVWGSDILIGGNSIILRFLPKFALKKADLITCDGTYIRDTMIEKFGTDYSKIKIIYFGIDTEKFSPGPKNRNLIEKLKIQNSPVVISLRSFEPIYDIKTLIEAIPLVLKKIPNTKFIIAGKGSQEEELKNLAKKLKVLESIRFIGFISHEELPQYLRIADIYVSTSLSDTTSVSLLEAMACELPPIVTEVGENRKILKEGANGFLVPIKNPELLAHGIIYLLNNEEIRKNFGKVNRKMIVEDYNYFTEMSKVESIYTDLIQKNI